MAAWQRAEKDKMCRLIIDAYAAHMAGNKEATALRVCEIAALGPVAVHTALCGWSSSVVDGWPPLADGERWQLDEAEGVLRPEERTAAQILVDTANDDHEAIAALVRAVWTPELRRAGEVMVDVLYLAYSPLAHTLAVSRAKGGGNPG